MGNGIKIHGIANSHSESNCCDEYKYCKQICETEKLVIDESKPQINHVLEAFVRVCITSHDIIRTQNGCKLVINGNKIIKIHYTSKSRCGKIYREEFVIPFCTFILLKDGNTNIQDILSGVEYCDIRKDSNCDFYVSLIIFVCPITTKKTHHSKCEYDDSCDHYVGCYDRGYDDDCNSKNDDYYDCECLDYNTIEDCKKIKVHLNNCKTKYH